MSLITKVTWNKTETLKVEQKRKGLNNSMWPIPQALVWLVLSCLRFVWSQQTFSQWSSSYLVWKAVSILQALGRNYENGQAYSLRSETFSLQCCVKTVEEETLKHAFSDLFLITLLSPFIIDCSSSTRLIFLHGSWPIILFIRIDNNCAFNLYAVLLSKQHTVKKTAWTFTYKKTHASG